MAPYKTRTNIAAVSEGIEHRRRTNAPGGHPSLVQIPGAEGHRCHQYQQPQATSVQIDVNAVLCLACCTVRQALVCLMRCSIGSHGTIEEADDSCHEVSHKVVGR